MVEFKHGEALKEDEGELGRFSFPAFHRIPRASKGPVLVQATVAESGGDLSNSVGYAACIFFPGWLAKERGVEDGGEKARAACPRKP